MSRCVCGARLADDRDVLCPLCQHEFDEDRFNPEEEDPVATPLPNLQLTLLYEIAAERVRQDLKWGEQNHPDGTGGEEADFLAKALRDWCDKSHDKGTGTWASILVEEVAEALAEADEDALVVELMQSAAVAVGWVESIRRRQQRREDVA